MTKEQLEKTLFGKRMRVYTVIDGASTPDLRQRLYEMRPPNYCLFRGNITPDIAEAAPYVIDLLPNRRFTEWALNEVYGNKRGIFAHCPNSIIEMRRHFRSIFKVYSEDGNPMIFRFYDPRVIRNFLPTCNPGELKSFFGKVESFFVEDEKAEKLLEFTMKDSELKQTELN